MYREQRLAACGKVSQPICLWVRDDPRRLWTVHRRSPRNGRQISTASSSTLTSQLFSSRAHDDAMKRPRQRTMMRAVGERFAAAFVAFVCISSQLSSFAHEASTVHVTCAEHGEPVDVPSVAHAHSASTHAAFENGNPPAGVGGHDHCAFALHGRQSSTTTVRALCSAPDHVISPPPPIAAATAPGPIRALYRLAPKTSPPV